MAERWDGTDIIREDVQAWRALSIVAAIESIRTEQPIAELPPQKMPMAKASVWWLNRGYAEDTCH